MKSINSAVALVLAHMAVVFACPGWAMSFKIVPSPQYPSKNIVHAEGIVEPGDLVRFRAVLDGEAELLSQLAITSPGGSVSAALALADEIEARGFSVLGVGECASACAQIIFPAGTTSELTTGSVLGIHSCSLGGMRDDLCNEEIAQLAVARGFPYGTIDMFADLFDPAEMKWLSEIGARCFGFYRAPGDPRPIDGLKPCVDGIIYTLKTTAAPRPFGPSFDCSKAVTGVEIVLCRDQELMLSDSILGRVYDTARINSTAAVSQSIRSDQRAWIAQRNAACGPLIPPDPDFRASRYGALCLYLHNERRIYQLIDEAVLR